ncbi:MAG TPA: protein kinase [Polyangiaceae bacterium]|nr:protein kinase [Polyangiaceae bacterium]
MFPQIFGKYVLERELASGGMARVYLATLRGAVGFEKRLVVKQIRPELSLDEAFVRRFVEEAKIAVELSHPNIVPVYELGVEQGIYYMAMELCEGLTLTEILMETGPFDPAEGAYLGIEICRALDYAHRRGGVVHRDVTPRNVLLDEEGAVRLIDFGIAAPVTGARATERVEVFGSPGHMPPEQVRGERLTPATDVFAVGALLIEAWTGRPPFRRSSFEASAEALKESLPALHHQHQELAPVSDVIAQAVAQNAAERPQDAETLARKLRDFSRQFDSGDVAKRIGQRVRRSRKRLRSSTPWLPGESSGPRTPAASPQALLSSRPPPGAPRTPATPPMPPTPITPAGMQPITRTFAAREDLVEWTRKIASVPPGAPDAPSDTDRAAPPASPLPSVIETDEPATRAMPRSSVPPARRPFPWAIAGVSAVLLVIIAAVSLGDKPGNAGSPPLETARAAKPEAPPPPSATPLPPAPPAILTSAPPVASPPALSSSPRGNPGSAASLAPSAAIPSGTATLRLTSDPQATVTVVGGKVSKSLATPVVALELPPGRYSISFRSATFEQPVATTVDLSANMARGFHADFRDAVPTLRPR